ncbi:MAG: NADH:flavin oxidoreductase [Clostridiaceae bacterium]
MRILNTPITINNLKLENRLVMPPIATAKSEDDGIVTEQLCNYYAEKSAGGYIGLIITEYSYISKQGKAVKGQLSISKEEDIEGLRKLISIIHGNNSKVFAQINHAGSGTKEETTGVTVVGPSIVLNPFLSKAPDPERFLPKEITIEEIKQVIADFAAAAIRVKKAGFDGVEIHAAHGYLLNQFYSPITNKRTDQYNGNTIQGRIRLHLEVIRAVREAVGEDYPVAIRFGASDFMPDGSTIEDGVLAAKEFEKAGIDLLDISGGFCGYTPPNSKGQGYFYVVTEEIIKNVSVPVILTGGIVDADAAETLLQEQKADLVGVGRAILKDSEWAKKAMQK